MRSDARDMEQPMMRGRNANPWEDIMKYRLFCAVCLVCAFGSGACGAGSDDEALSAKWRISKEFARAVNASIAAPTNFSEVRSTVAGLEFLLSSGHFREEEKGAVIATVIKIAGKLEESRDTAVDLVEGRVGNGAPTSDEERTEHKRRYTVEHRRAEVQTAAMRITAEALRGVKDDGERKKLMDEGLRGTDLSEERLSALMSKLEREVNAAGKAKEAGRPN